MDQLVFSPLVIHADWIGVLCTQGSCKLTPGTMGGHMIWVDQYKYHTLISPEPHPQTTGRCVHVQSLSRVWLFVTLWTGACQAPLSVGFFRHQYWSGLPFPPPRDLSVPGIEPTSPALAGGFFTTEPHGKSTGWPDSSQQEPAQSFVLGAFGKGESPS